MTLGGDSLEQAGPDLTGLFVGSEGLFGIALEITLRLVPRPAVYRTVLAAYDSLQAAGDAVSRVIESGLLPGAMEIMDRLAMDAAEAAVHAGYPTDAAAVLIVELRGRARAGGRGVRPADARSSRRRAPRTRTSPPTTTSGRASGRAARARSPPSAGSARTSSSRTAWCPRARLGEALATIEALSRAHGIRVANVFHAGDGNLHPLILYDGREAGAHDRAEVLAAEILRLCIRLGGSITGEHGVGLEKRAVPRRDVRRGRHRLHAAPARGDGPARRGQPRQEAAPLPPATSASHGLHPLERAGVISRA